MSPRYIGVLVLAAVGLISSVHALTQGEIVTAAIGAGCVVLLLVNANWSSWDRLEEVHGDPRDP